MTEPSGWFALDELDALLQSSAYPADEWDAPDCGEGTVAPNGMGVYCTRAGGHDGRHIAAVRGSMEGHVLFEIAAAWPGEQTPRTDYATPTARSDS